MGDNDRMMYKAVTYSTLETKTIDDFSVRQLKNEKKLPKNTALPFVSSDEAENHDLSHLDWKTYFNKKIKDRYATSERWKTSVLPNPNVNLSCYNWRKKNALPRPKNNQEHLSADESTKYHMDQIFKMKEEKLIHEFHKKYKYYSWNCNSSNLQSDFDRFGCQTINSSISNWRTGPANEEDLRNIYEVNSIIFSNFKDEFKKINDCKNDVVKILKYYQNLLNENVKKESFPETDLLYLSKNEFKQWIEREEIMDMI